MPTTITLTSATDTLAFYATPDVNGYVYNNVTLDAWYALADVDAKLSKRPNAHGAYGLGQIFAGAAKPIVSGQFYGATAAAALAARNRLAGFFADGKSVTMTVADDLGTTSREVWLVDLDATFRWDFSHLPFDIVFTAPDPRRYSASSSTSDGLPSSGTGLQWNLGSLTLFFDWGTAGTLGQVAYTNTGNAATAPRIEVGGAGGFAAGFRVTEIETGRELTFTRATVTGETVVLDSRTGRATINGGDVGAFLSSRKWFSIPAGATRRYQITPLGSTSGTPTITLIASSANL